MQRHAETLGKTGEGITTEEDIDMSKDNTFTNLWGTYRHDIIHKFLADSILCH